MKAKELLIIWTLCIVNISFFISEIIFEKLTFIQGWLIWLYIFFCYYVATVHMVQNKMQKRSSWFDVMKYSLQIVLLFESYNYFNGNFTLGINKVTVVMIGLIVLVAVSLSFQKVDNGAKIVEDYIDKEQIKVLVQKRISGQILKEKEQQKIDIILLNNFSLILLFGIGFFENCLADSWHINLWALTIPAFGEIIFLIINQKKYNLCNIALKVYARDMLGASIGMVFILCSASASISFPVLLFQLYCFTPFLLSFFEMRYYSLSAR